MIIQCFPAAAIAAATFAVWLRLAAPAMAQESSAPQSAPSAAPGASTVPLSSVGEDILKLSRAKVRDDVAIAFIQNGDHRYTLTASEIIYLRKEGVSDGVLTAMLNQQSRASAAQTSPQAAAPATDAFASPPQYVAPPATTVVEQTSPASTVYAAESTPTYYSFGDPWPYWYDPWPYYYPYSSLGFSWGWGWGGCYNGYWNNYCHNGYYDHNGHNGHDGHDGNHHSSPSHRGGQRPGGRPSNGGQPRNGNPPSHNGGSKPGGQPGTYASDGRPSRGVSQPRSDAIRAASTAPTGRPTSYWSGNGNPSAVARGRQPNAVASRGSQAGGATRSWGSSANNRITPGPSLAQGGAQSSRAGYVSRGESVGSAKASPTGVWSRPGGQMGNRYAGTPASSPQRSAVGSSSSSRTGGNFVSTGRPSTASSYGGTINSGGFRGGGSYRGGSAPRMSSGGGHQGGGGFRGGGGGGSRR